MNARKWEWIINKDIRQNSKTTTKAMKTPILTGLTSSEIAFPSHSSADVQRINIYSRCRYTSAL